MILAALVLLRPIVAAPHVVEVIDPKVETIAFHAVARLPDLGEKELAAARVLAEVLTQGTEEYSSASIQRYSSLAGSRARCFLYADSLHVRVVVPKGQMSLGVSLLDSLVRRVSLPEDGINAAIAKQPFRFRSYWLEALDPWIANYSRLSRNDVSAIYRSAFRPETLFVAVGGAFGRGSAASALNERWAQWQMARPFPWRPSRLARPLEAREAGITTIDLVGPVLKSNDPDFTARMLAVFALGTGKQSGAFKTVRESEGLAYRVESILWPHPKGWQPRILLAFDSKRGPEGAAERVLAGLMKDVKAWNFESKERAIGMAEAALVLGLELNPFYFRGESTIRGTLDDRTFLAAYWPMKTGKAWEPEKLLASMREVEIDALRSAAEEILKASFSRVIVGSK